MDEFRSTLDRTCYDRRGFLARSGMAAIALASSRVQGGPTEDFDAFVVSRMRAAGIPGLALGLARHGRVELSRGYGFADLASKRRVTANTMFHIASLTKTVTATAVQMLVEAGLVSLDDPIEKHLDFPVTNPAHPDVPIRVRHLLTHVSGISDATYYAIDFRAQGKDSLMPLRVFLTDYLVPGGHHYSASGSYSARPPGSEWHYSNVGYGLLGYLAGRVAGEDLRAYIGTRLFEPLGMRHTSWTIAGVPERLRATPYDDVQGVRTPATAVGFPDWPAGMLRASVADFLRFVAASANGGEADGVRVIGQGGMAQMLDMQKPAGLPDWLTGQGLGWMESPLGGVPHINHWGGDPGVFTATYLEPGARAGVAIFTNASATNDRKAAVRAIAATLLDVEVKK